MAITAATTAPAIFNALMAMFQNPAGGIDFQPLRERPCRIAQAYPGNGETAQTCPKIIEGCCKVM